MSVDTRTPRTPTGGRSPGFDDEPVLSSVKVPCDPAQVIVNHASFRVQLAAPVASAAAETTRIPVVGQPAGARRRAPVVWSGHTEQGESAATQLLHAVRNSGAVRHAEDAGATQVLPRVRLEEDTHYGAARTPTVVGPRDGSDTDTAQLRPVRPAAQGQGPGRQGVYGDGEFEGPYGSAYGAAHEDGYGRYDEAGPAGKRGGADDLRQGYYPGRRMNLGVVLLPLRIFLGLISVYAGMGKLCDPVYFDGGERGSMVKWLTSLHPWGLAAPLRDFALSHPVGAGLTVAFLQVVVGVLTMCGLWQRVAGSIGALLSAALLMTVSWRTVPAYDAPDIIYLAAWSPLIIAGAPVYSLDARLAGEAWRTLGPRAELWELRRRVLRRGAVMTAVVAGLTLLIGSLLGGAVRSTTVPPVPEPGQPAINNLPGSPLPRPAREGDGRKVDGGRKGSVPKKGRGKPSTGASRPAGTASSPSVQAPETARATGSVSSGATQPGPATGRPPQQSAPTRAPAPTQAPTVGGTGGGTNGGSTGGSSSGSDGGSGGGGSDGGGTLGGLLG